MTTTIVTYVDIGHVFVFFLCMYVLVLLGVAFIFTHLVDVSCQYLPMVPPLCYLASEEEDDPEEEEETEESRRLQENLDNDRWQFVRTTTSRDDDYDNNHDDLTCTTTTSSNDDSFDEDEYGQFWEEMEELDKDHMDFMAMQQFLDMDTILECPVMIPP